MGAISRRPAEHLAHVLAIAAATAFAIGVGAPALAQEPAAAAFGATTLDLSAQGEVKAEPDIADLSVGVTSRGATAAEALASQRARMASTVAALKAEGVAAPDIQTSALSLNPQYSDEDRGQRRLTGYEATNMMSARLRDLKRVGAVVDAVVAAGADRIDGLTFGIADPAPLQDEARRRAVRALQARADLYAQATGYRVKRLVRLGEDAAIEPQPMMRGMVVVTGARRTPIETGELTVRVTVSAEYELAR